MGIYLEHANMTVPDLDAAIRFLKTVDPDFVVRHRAISERGYTWAHVGNEQCYIALQEPHPGSDANRKQRPYEDIGVNHLGWAIDDLDAVDTRLLEAGYERVFDEIYGHEYRRSVYFYDDAGFEWELNEYRSSIPEQRNKYI